MHACVCWGWERGRGGGAGIYKKITHQKSIKNNTSDFFSVHLACNEKQLAKEEKCVCVCMHAHACVFVCKMVKWTCKGRRAGGVAVYTSNLSVHIIITRCSC